MKTKLFLIDVMISVSFLSCAQEKKQKFETPLNILVFSKTSGFHHESISSGVKMLYDKSQEQNWVVTATESDRLFREGLLEDFDLVVFLNPSGDAVSDEGQAAFEKWMNNGKGFVGIHAAADCEYEWPYYGNLVGGYFKIHPPAQTGTVVFENFDHPAMEPFKGTQSYTTFDEWYSFRENPRKNVNVLATLDESSIKKSDNDDWKMCDHPIIWWKEENGIRSFYTGFGHTHESFQDKKIIQHITTPSIGQAEE
jgi:type 1 glutamine amidotransferase